MWLKRAGWSTDHAKRAFRAADDPDRRQRIAEIAKAPRGATAR